MLKGNGLTAGRVAEEVDALIESIGEGMLGAEPQASYEMRYAGQAFELAVPGPPDPDPGELAEQFAAAHEERYGYRDPDGVIELVNVRLAMVEPGPQLKPRAADSGVLDESTREARFGDEWIEAKVLRGEPSAGLSANGPLVFELPEATLVLPPGWSAEVDESGTIVATRDGDGSGLGA
jgi:N-methylhydantoinase A